MKISYVVHDFFPKFFGGTERYVLNIAKQMQRMGYNVKVVTSVPTTLLRNFNPSAIYFTVLTPSKESRSSAYGIRLSPLIKDTGYMMICWKI